VAYLFSLAVECGDEDAATACAEHFSGLAVDATVKRSSEDGAWWAVVSPDGVSTSGVTSPEVAESLTAAGQALLEHLRSAPRFRFALPGVEAFEALTLEQLDESEGSDPSFPERFDGLVVSDEVRERLGADAPFEPFAPGYSWFPYQGERHR
jgi:hypothetical protein